MKLNTRRLLLLILFVFAVLLLAFLVRESRSIEELLDSLLWMLLLVLFAIVLLVPYLFKLQLLKTLSDDMAIAVAKVDDFPLLDRARLQTLDTELNALGFSPVQDYTLHHPTTKIVPVFARAYLHTDSTCYAEVGQYFSVAKPQPMTLVFISYFGEGPPHQSPFEGVSRAAPLPAPGASETDGLEWQSATHAIWSYATTDAPHRTFLRVLRRPRSLSRRMQAGPRAMYEQHLADRAKIEARLQLPVAGELTFQRYFNWAIRARRAYRWQARHQNIYLALLRAFFNKSDTWWGDLGRDFDGQ